MPEDQHEWSAPFSSAACTSFYGAAIKPPSCCNYPAIAPTHDRLDARSQVLCHRALPFEPHRALREQLFRLEHQELSNPQ